ncbi:hypothetical protein [Streptomyces mirabilis]|uniref:hypothetical protein n=1 Tax=Streptomyces mirabilis TaxID=68239 RepID=UPI0033EFCD28
MTAEQLPADCTPDWTDDPANPPPDPRLYDLRGQGVGLVKLHNATDVTINEDYL